MSTAENQLRAEMPIHLGDGLQLRFAQHSDIDRLVELAAREFGAGAPAIWVGDLLEGSHPNVSYRDFTLVEDRSTGCIASSMGLVSQTWSYGGIPFGCGQPENVNTSPEYRRRGLVRRQFEIIHRLSEARGELLQAIWGVPWFYRQFGYEYAMRSEWPNRWRVHEPWIPKLKEGECEPFTLRPIQKRDRAFVRALYEKGSKRSIFAAVKEDRDWDFYFRGYSRGALRQFWWYIICNSDSKAIGYLTLQDSSFWHFVDRLELASGFSYLQVLPSILRQLINIEPKNVVTTGPEPRRGYIELSLPLDHPVGQALPTETTRRRDATPVWYVRMPDVVAFLRRVRPALEANLIGTEAEGYSGELNINCFRWGLHLRFEAGRVTEIAPWRTNNLVHRPAFPGFTFLQILCGLNRCAGLAAAHPDCLVDDVSARLLDALFPPFHGGLWLGN